MSEYFTFTFNPSVGALFADTTRPYILLPISLGKVFDLQEGDEVTLEISKDLPEATFTVAGFIDTYFDNMAITNLVNVPAYADVAPVNALMINAGSDAAIETAIIQAYSSRMYYLVDTEEVIAENVAMFLSVADYLTLIGWAVVFCFMIVILNNAVLVFDAMKADYARLMVLGVGARRLTGLFAAEAGILALIAAAVAAVDIAMFFPAMPELMLLFGNYKVIPLDWAKAALGIGAGILVFLIGYGTYFFKVKHMRIVEEITKY
jgi:predicted lysophospholipase L1 biosynthesis ABC-type transport system permease subunit